MNKQDLEQLLQIQSPQQPLSDQHRQLWLAAMRTVPPHPAPRTPHPVTAVALRALLALAAGGLLAILLWPSSKEYPVAQQLPVEPSVAQPGPNKMVTETTPPQVFLLRPSLTSFEMLNQQLQSTDRELDLLLQQAQMLDVQQQASELLAQMKAFP